MVNPNLFFASKSQYIQRRRSFANFKRNSFLWQRWVIYSVEFLPWEMPARLNLHLIFNRSEAYFTRGVPDRPRNVMTFRSCQPFLPICVILGPKKPLLPCFKPSFYLHVLCYQMLGLARPPINLMLYVKRWWNNYIIRYSGPIPSR